MTPQYQSPATARVWGGLVVITAHPNGRQVAVIKTSIPAVFAVIGGAGFTKNGAFHSKHFGQFLGCPNAGNFVQGAVDGIDVIGAQAVVHVWLGPTQDAVVVIGHVTNSADVLAASPRGKQPKQMLHFKRRELNGTQKQGGWLLR